MGWMRVCEATKARLAIRACHRPIRGDKMVNSVWLYIVLFCTIAFSVSGCTNSRSGSPPAKNANSTPALVVHIPDHPEQNPKHFRIGDAKVDIDSFEAELRQRLASNEYSRIQVSTGKAGDKTFEELVASVAAENRIPIERLPPPTGDL